MYKVSRDHHQCTAVTSPLMGSDMCWTIYILLKYKNWNCSCSRKSDSVVPCLRLYLYETHYTGLLIFPLVPARDCVLIHLCCQFYHTSCNDRWQNPNLLSQSFRIAENNAPLLVAVNLVSFWKDPDNSRDDMAELLKSYSVFVRMCALTMLNCLSANVFAEWCNPVKLRASS